MRRLLDESLQDRLVERLSADGHDLVHARRLGMQGTAADEVMAKAVAEGRILVTTDTDSVPIWDLASGQLLQTIQIGGSVRNIEFLDQHHLLVTQAEGPLLVVTLDLDELLGIARDRLTRGFVREECAAYGLDPCPTLASLKGG